MTNVLLVILFGTAIVLTLLSAWTFSRYAYYLLVALFAAGFLVDVVSQYTTSGKWDLTGLAIDLCIFGFLFYFITVQNVMGHKVTAVVTGPQYKDFLVEKNKYHGFLKFVYHLPFVLIVLGVCIAVYWKFLA
jgi:hypothetical protein